MKTKVLSFFKCTPIRMDTEVLVDDSLFAKPTNLSEQQIMGKVSDSQQRKKGFLHISMTEIEQAAQWMHLMATMMPSGVKYCPISRIFAANRAHLLKQKQNWEILPALDFTFHYKEERIAVLSKTVIGRVSISLMKLIFSRENTQQLRNLKAFSITRVGL